MTHKTMDLDQAQALARMEESQPDYINTVLRDSGYGDLADQWLNAASEFETAARESSIHIPQDPDADISTPVVRAYARLRVSWSRISQLREQALGSIERLTHRN